MSTLKIKSVEELRKEYIEEQCEVMDGEEDRYSVYENDGELVADWWIDKITQDRHSLHTSLVAAVEGMKNDLTRIPKRDPISRDIAEIENAVLDDTLTIINSIFKE